MPCATPPPRPSLMNRLRRFARRGSIVWVVLLVLGAGGTVSRLFGPRQHHATAPQTSAPAEPTSTEETLALLDGIPQHGATLGDPGAPVELIEFADLQCPFCAAVNSVLLPPLIQRYVRTGQVKLVFQDLHFLGPDSERLGKVAEGMGMQNRLWQFVELAFEHQGRENSGYATDLYVTKVVSEVPGTDVAAALSDRDSPTALDALRRASEEADRLHVRETPSFFLARRGATPREISIQSLEGPAFARELSGGKS
jgi:protein-disulfide isomerase